MKPLPAFVIFFFVMGSAGCRRIGGMDSNYQAKDFDPQLTEFAQSAAPLIRALDSQIKATGVVPESLIQPLTKYSGSEIIDLCA